MADDSLNLNITANASGFSNTVKGVLGQLGGLQGVFASLGGTALFTKAISEAAEMEGGITRLNQTLKSTKGVAGVTTQSAIDLANAMQKVTTYSDDAGLAGENVLLQFKGIGKDVFPQATKAALDLAAATGKDVNSAFEETGKVLNNPLRGLTLLERQGVKFTTQQKQQIKLFVQTNQLAKAQGIILGELSSVYGGQAAAAVETFNGQMDQLGNAVNDVFKSFGSMLIPVLKVGVGVLKGVADAIGGLDPVFKIAIIGAGALALAMSPIVVAIAPIVAIVAAVGGGILLANKAWTENWGGIQTTITGAAGPIIAEVGRIKDAIASIFAPQENVNPVGAAGVGKLPGGYDAPGPMKTGPDSFNTQAPKKQSNDFGERIKAALGIDPAAITALWTTSIKPALDSLSEGIKGFIGSLEGTDFSGVEKLLKIVGVALAGITTTVSTGVLGALDGIGKALPLFGAALKDFINGLAAAGNGDPGGALTKIGEGLGKLGEGALKIPEGIATKIGAIFHIDVKEGLKSWEGIGTNIGLIVGGIFGPGGIIDQKLLAFKTSWDSFWGQVGAGFAALFKPVTDGLGALSGLPDLISAAVTGAIDWLTNVVPTAWNAAWTALTQGAGKILSGLKGLILGPIISALVQIKAALRAVGTAMQVAGLDNSMVSGFANGLDSAIGSLTGKASGGPVTGGRAYMVGERGPELFMPGGNGHIVPNHALGGGGGNVNVTLNVYGVQDPSRLVNMVDQELQRRNRPKIGRK